MLIKGSVYLLILFLNFVSWYLLVRSIKNDNKSLSKRIIWIDIAYILYCILCPYIIEKYKITTGFEILLLLFLNGISIIVYIVSIFYSSKKLKNPSEFNDVNCSKLITLLLIIIPIVFPTYATTKDRILINNSEVLLFFRSSGNGGIGDGNSFAFAINDGNCKQFDIGTSNNYLNSNLNT